MNIKIHTSLIVVIMVIAVIQPAVADISNLSFEEAEVVLQTEHRDDNTFVGAMWLNGRTIAEFVYSDGKLVYRGEVPFETFNKALFEITSDHLDLKQIPSTIDGIKIGSPTVADIPGPWGSKYPYSGIFYIAEDSWWTTDKLAHMLGCYVLSVKLRGFTNGNKYTAALYALGIGALWEVKDSYVHWRDFGRVGGDGFSLKDLTADFIGIIYSLQLLDPVAEKIKKFIGTFDRAVVSRILRPIIPKSGTLLEPESYYDKRMRGIFWIDPPIFWGRIGRVVIYNGLVIGTFGLYNYAVDGEFYPDGTTWLRDDSPGARTLLGTTYNWEVSVILGPFGQSLSSDCASDEIGLLVGQGFVFGHESLNAIFTSQNVPFLGDKENGGWRPGDIGMGTLVNFGWYGIKKIAKSLTHHRMFGSSDTNIGLTPGGLGISTKTNFGKAWISQYKSNGISLGITF